MQKALTKLRNVPQHHLPSYADTWEQETKPSTVFGMPQGFIIAYPVEFCQDGKTEKNAGLPLDKPEKNAYNKNRKSIPADGCSHIVEKKQSSLLAGRAAISFYDRHGKCDTTTL